MPQYPQRKPSSAQVPVEHLRCPMCGSKLLRERRRLVDRLRSLFAPVKRFRCENFACQWQGNFPDAGVDTPAADRVGSTHARGHAQDRAGGVPAAFIVHMALVAAGIVFVLLISAMDLGFRSEEQEPTIETGVYRAAPEQSAGRMASR